MIEPPVRNQREGTGGLYWERTPSPSPFLEQPFQILSGSDPQCFTIDLQEELQAEAAQPMTVFGFRK
jgi:hypothetical protein